MSWCLCGLLFFIAIVYSRCLANGFVADDWDQIEFNPYIGHWSFVWKSMIRDVVWFNNPNHLPQSPYYRSMHDIWLALNFHLFGTRPLGWHAEMVVLHLLVVWMVYRVAGMLAGDRTVGLAAAALFGLMPLSIEAVVVIAAVPEPLCAAFALGAFEFYLRSRAADSAGGNAFKPLAISLALFAGALLSYENAAVFPALVAAHAFLRGEHRTYRSYRTYMSYVDDCLRATLFAVWPYFAELAAYLAMRWWVLGFIVGPGNGMLTARDVILTVPSALWDYLSLIAMPWRGSPAHPLYAPQSMAAPGFYVPAIGLAAISLAAILALKRDPRWRLHLFCVAWFLIALAPMLNLGGLFGRAAIQDRYLYFALFGVCTLAADLGVEFARRSKTQEAAAGIAGAAIALGYATLIFNAEPIWHDDVTLFTRCAAEIPQWAFFHSQLGNALDRRGDYAGARNEFAAAIKLQPYNGVSYYRLALVEEKLGDRRAAAREMAHGLELLPGAGPDQYAQLAVLRDAAGDRTGAEAALQHAAELPGGAETAALGRAQIQFLHGDSKNAEQAMRDLVRRNPGNERMLTILGSMLSAGKHYDEALEIYRRAAAIKPNDLSLRYKIAAALYELGRGREARDECAAVLAAVPGDPNARALMAAIERSGTE